MNPLFKNSKKIILDDKYSIIPDSDHGLVLVFEEQRQREKIDVKTKKKTGEIEDYTFTDKWYYPKTSFTLDRYLRLKLGETKDLEDIKNTLERIEKKVDELKENW